MKKLYSIGLVLIMLLTILTSCKTETVEASPTNYDELLEQYEQKTETYIDEIYQKYGEVKRLVVLDIFGQKEKDGKIEYYTRAYDTCYTLFKGKVYDGGGSGYADFCVITTEQGKITDLWYPQDGSYYLKSIKERVGLIDQLKFKNYDGMEALRNKSIAKAQEYFDARFSENVLNIEYDEATQHDKYEIWQVDSTDIKIIESGVLNK